MGGELTVFKLPAAPVAALSECFPTRYAAREGETAGFMLGTGRNPTPEEVEQAKARLAAMEAVPTIQAQDLAVWLLPARVLPSAPERRDIPAYAAVVLLALKDVPRSVLTAETIGAALRDWEFWPTPKRIAAALEPAAAAWRTEMDQLRAIIRRGSPVDAPISESGAVQGVIGSMVASIARRPTIAPPRRVESPQLPPERPRPLYVTGDALKAMRAGAPVRMVPPDAD